MKVVELILDSKAYGWSKEELHFQHPYLTMGQMYIDHRMCFCAIHARL